jgi:hypothetical protein
LLLSSRQSQLTWAELALVSIPPAPRPPVRLFFHPPGLVVNKQEISLTCFVTFVSQKTSKQFSKFGKTEDNHQGRQPKQKNTFNNWESAKLA